MPLQSDKDTNTDEQPIDLTDLANRVWQKALAGDYQAAIPLYDLLTSECKTLRDLRNRGTNCLLMGDYEEALHNFLDSRLIPGYTTVVNELVGSTLWLMNAPVEACEDWAYETRRRRAKELIYFDTAGGVQVPALLWWASIRLGCASGRQLAEAELKRRWRTKQRRQSVWPRSLVPALRVPLYPRS